MRGVVWLVLLFAVAVVAATALGANDGLVSVYWNGWRTDLSLNLFLLLLLAACFVATTAARAIEGLVSLPRRAGEWRALRRERAAHAALREALAQFWSARYSRAHKAARQAIALTADAQKRAEAGADGEFLVLAHLLAAGSLHRLQDRPKRDDTMARLFALLPAVAPSGRRRADDGARLLAAEWALEDRDAERALALLVELPAGAQRRTHALRLKLQASRQLRRPLEALHTARLLANHGAFTPLAATSLLRSLALEVLEQAHDTAQLQRAWQQLDRSDQRDALVAARAAARASAFGAHDAARDWLRPFWDRLPELDRDAREAIALALAEATPGIGPDWLPRLEQALGSFGHEPAVAAAVGAAFADRGLWGKARRLLEQAAEAPLLASRARRRAWHLLARLAAQEGDEGASAGFQRAAAAIDG
jgi:HemY protein